MAGSISDFYSGKNIFVTGGTGFIGRVLIEKLLRSCPDVGNIYVLIRRKKSVDISERLNEIINIPLFDVLKRMYPDNLQKIIPIAGDCDSLRLGLSDSDYQMLEDNVHIIFHGAATVRFDDPLAKTIILNVRATREMMDLGKKVKNLEVLVYVSTAYCNCDKQVIEERLYPAPADWSKIIEAAETVDDYTLRILEKKIIGALPNTYTFSKALGEHVVNDLSDNLPVVIIRPSIVTGTWYDPLTGWTDNFNGPTGLSLAILKGLLRIMYLKQNGTTKVDCVPCDFTVRIICAAAWEKAKSRRYGEPTIYNVTALDNMFVTAASVLKFGKIIIEEKPLENPLWVPRSSITDKKLVFVFNCFVFQLIPAFFIDEILKWSGHKPMLMYIQRKLWNFFIAVNYFMNTEFTFKNDKLLWLDKQLGPKDSDFSVKGFEDAEFSDIMESSWLGMRKYLLNETQSFEENKKHLKRLRFLEKLIVASICMFVLWFLYHFGYFQNLI